MQKKHIMVDIETLSTKSNAHILSIGAVAFTALGKKGRFYRTIAIKDYGLHLDAETIAWWAKQPESVRLAAFSDTQDLVTVLEDFHAFVSAGCDYIWANSVSFDLPILANAYASVGLAKPWNFRQEMCYRTIKNLHPNLPVAANPDAHNALADAEFQTKYLLATGVLL